MRSIISMRRVVAMTVMIWHAPLQAQGTVADGQVVFKSRCAVCHGMEADGRSELARIMRPPPANLRASALSDEAQTVIVRQGGAAVGRSPNMPEWQQELTEEELVSVLAYIRTVKVSAP